MRVRYEYIQCVGPLAGIQIPDISFVLADAKVCDLVWKKIFVGATAHA